MSRRRRAHGVALSGSVRRGEQPAVARWRAAWVAVLLNAWLLMGVAQAQPGFSLEIDAPQELRDALRSRTLAGRWLDEPGVDPDQIPLFAERAREEAQAIAQGAGFFAARVDVAIRQSAGAPATIRIQVDAGERTRVATVALAVAGEAAGTDDERALREAWPLATGSVFRSSDWELAKRQAIERLSQRGYLRARIAASLARVDAAANIASLEVGVDSGPRLAFGGATIRGLARYPASLVASLRPWRDGDAYDFERLLAWQQRLRATGHFIGVSVLPDLAALEADPSLDRVPVTVELTERQAHQLTLGAGVSSDQGPRVVGGFEHRNLLGRGWLLESGALVETVRRRVFATVTTPWDDTGHRVQVGVRTERADVSGELVERNTVVAGQGRRTDDIESFASLQYQTERRAVDATGEAMTDRRAALSAGYSWTLRRLDSRADPRDGHTLSVQLSGALKGLGSDRSFARAYLRAMRFWPMPPDSMLAGGVLVGLLEAGMVAATSRDDIPTENLFRAGGAQSVRGWRYLGLGVREGDAVVGGRVLALGSLEYQHPVMPDWRLAVFRDAGNAADRWADWRAVHGYGVGARWRSPVGPVNLDLARGDPSRRLRAHFSVGYSF